MAWASTLVPWKPQARRATGSAHRQGRSLRCRRLKKTMSTPAWSNRLCATPAGVRPWARRPLTAPARGGTPSSSKPCPAYGRGGEAAVELAEAAATVAAVRDALACRLLSGRWRAGCAGTPPWRACGRRARRALDAERATGAGAVSGADRPVDGAAGVAAHRGQADRWTSRSYVALLVVPAVLVSSQLEIVGERGSPRSPPVPTSCRGWITPTD